MALFPQKISFAIANSAAILAALFIAFAENLERPYWAMFTVFIIAKPISGAVRSKGLYRLAGTLAGAAVALLLVPVLVQMPALLCLALSLWVGFCVYVSLFDRSPRSYAFLLAGYSATIVGFSVVDSPLQIFDTVVARVEEISLGIACAAVAHTVFFPQSVTWQIAEQVEGVLKVCKAWIADLFAPNAPADSTKRAADISAIVVNLHGLYTHVAFETSNVPRRAAAMIALIDSICTLAPAISGVEVALAELRERSDPSRELRSTLTNVAVWARRADEVDGVDTLLSELGSVQSAAEASKDLCEVLIAGKARTLIENLVEVNTMSAAMLEWGDDTSAAPVFEPSVARARPLYRDPGLALLSGAAAAGATLLACTLWIGLSWPEGGVAAQFAAIGCSLFATLDNPAKVIWRAVIAILVALPIAAVYEFAILPQATGFESLALALLPLLVLLSFMQTYEALEGAALILAIAFSGALALQESYRADFAVFLNSNTAEIVGLLIAIVANRVFRAIDPAWNAMRITRAGWQSVLALARDRNMNIEPWTVRMFDRVGLIASRVLLLPQAERPSSIDGLRDMRVGLQLATLRTVACQLDVGAALKWVFDGAAEVYEAKISHLRGPERRAIDESIEDGVAALFAKPPSEAKSHGLAALAGLRLDLAPSPHLQGGGAT